MSLGLHPCTAAERSCPPVLRCWQAEILAVRCLHTVMISNKEKFACKAQFMEMEVSETGSPGGVLYTQDEFLSSSAQRYPALSWVSKLSWELGAQK